jgi:D-sedoheptulose 7-phosphate isomerase
MKIVQKLETDLNSSIEAKKSLLKEKKIIFETINIIYSAIKNKKKIFLCGNGGSAADAQHLSAEYIDRLRPKINRRPLPLISLALDTSHLTACSNDFNFSQVFSRPLSALGTSGDVLICISTSGNSKNILNVLKLAKKMRIKTISFLGKKGGKAKKYSKTSIIVNSENVARIQEAHIFLGHFVLEVVENKLFNR